MERSDWYGKSWSFFQNRGCDFFPCHAVSDEADFNCLFCWCPLYALGEGCGGRFTYLEDGTKDCSGCLIPHAREGYGYVAEKFPQISELASKK